LRIASTRIEIESIVVQENDVVVRTRNPNALKHVLKNEDVTVRLVGNRLTSGAIAVFLRPSIGICDPKAVLTFLRDAFLTRGQCDHGSH
jgi:hypothetical protein